MNSELWKIPILIVTFDRLAYTKRVLSSLVENTEVDFKLVIIDNASTDGTVDWLKTFSFPSNTQIVFNPENRGVVGAMNQFFNLTYDYKYVAKVDNDSIVPRGWLNNLRLAMDNFGLYVVGPIYDPWPSSFVGKLSDFLDGMSRKQTPFQGGTVFFSPFVGGSGILIRRDKIQVSIPEQTLMEGWSSYQSSLEGGHPGCIAFYNGVKVRLLDINSKGERTEDYPDYNEMITVFKNERTRWHGTTK